LFIAEFELIVEFELRFILLAGIVFERVLLFIFVVDIGVGDIVVELLIVDDEFIFEPIVLVLRMLEFIFELLAPPHANEPAATISAEAIIVFLIVSPLGKLISTRSNFRLFAASFRKSCMDAI
jgi:hypothetical protein